MHGHMTIYGYNTTTEPSTDPDTDSDTHSNPNPIPPISKLFSFLLARIPEDPGVHVCESNMVVRLSSPISFTPVTPLPLVLRPNPKPDPNPSPKPAS